MGNAKVTIRTLKDFKEVTEEIENIEPDQQPLKLSNYLPYLGSFIIFLGVTRLIFFYSAFGISIVNFLDFSEIVTSFLDIIVISVFLFATSILQGFMLRDKEIQHLKDGIRKKILEEEHLLKRLWLHTILCKELIIGGLILTTSYFILHCFNKDITIASIAWGAAFFVICFVLLVIIREISRIHHKSNSSIHYRRFIAILFYTSLFSGLVISYAHKQADNIKKNKSTFGVTITLDNDQTLVSDSSNYYVGKTLNYLYIYHEKDNTADVIPINRVKQITFKRKTSEFKLYD